MRARWTILALLCCLVGAVLALRPAAVDAQQTGGSFGGSRWGSGGSSAPAKSWGQKRGGVARPSSWGSSYDYDDRPRRRSRQRSYGGGGGECAASLAMITTGLVGGLVVGRRKRRRGP